MALLSFISRKSSNNQLATEISTPKQKTSVAHLISTGIQFANASLQSHTNKRSLASVEYKLASEKSTLSQLNDMGASKGAIKISQNKITKLEKELNGYQNKITNLTKTKKSLDTELNNTGDARSKKAQDKQEAKEAEQTRKNGIKAKKTEINNQIKGLKSQISQVGSNAPPTPREESVLDDDVSRSENAQSGF